MMKKYFSLFIIFLGITSAFPFLSYNTMFLQYNKKDDNNQPVLQSEDHFFVVTATSFQTFDENNIISSLHKSNYRSRSYTTYYNSLNLFGVNDKDYIDKIIFVVAAIGGKLDGINVLNNTKRGKIYNYILNNPGSHLRQIMRHHEFSPNQVSYHLATLERHNLIVSYNDGRYKQYYANLRNEFNMEDYIDGIKVLKNENAQKILDILLSYPGITKSEIVSMTHLHRNTVTKITNQMCDCNIIEPGSLTKLTLKGYEVLTKIYNDHNISLKTLVNYLQV